jgi:dTDP-4-amino-4,6-dideoxygalactose transaminase
MHLAMMVLEINSGEVIVPNYTFTSTGLAPALSGAKPVLAEVEFYTANIDLEKIEKNITSRTKAIIPVHYAGLPCDMDDLLALAKKHNLLIVEDAAQAIGSTYKGKRAGSMGDIGCFSFHSVKNISCGEGGALVTNDDKLHEKALIMRDKGTNKYSYDLKATKGFYEYVSLGHNFMLSDILAAVGLAQFRKIDKINSLRKKHSETLLKGLAGISNLGLPENYEDRESNWHLFTVRVPEGKTEKFITEMRKLGVTTNTQYVPLHMNSYYQSFGYSEGDFPESERLYKSLVRLPMFPALTDSDLHRIITSVRSVMSSI